MFPARSTGHLKLSLKASRLRSHNSKPNFSSRQVLILTPPVVQLFISRQNLEINAPRSDVLQLYIYVYFYGLSTSRSRRQQVIHKHAE